MLEPGVTEDWSVRDLIAHVSVWEEETMKLLPILLDGGTTPKYSTEYGGVDAFNAVKTEEKQILSLSEVQTESQVVHRRLMDYLGSLPSDALITNERAKRRLRLDTHGHYPIHAEAIRQWRDAR